MCIKIQNFYWLSGQDLHKNNDKKNNKVINIEQLKIYSYYIKFLQFLKDLQCKNVSQASAFNAAIITQLIFKKTTCRKKIKNSNITPPPPNCHMTICFKIYSMCFLTMVSIFVQIISFLWFVQAYLFFHIFYFMNVSF